MLNKLADFIREYGLIRAGDSVAAAVSGGADSTALLFALYLLRDKLGFTLSAAHYNHHLRGEESDRDEQFVRQLCDRFDIPLIVGGGEVRPGPKGLEAAARDARYAFLRGLPGKVATAHTADDNAETVLMHMLRGTGLKGLGGIAPQNGNVIRPMLTVTRQDVEDFLTEYCLRHVEDSSNGGDSFLRNRIRHGVMPRLAAENPLFAASASAMALRLREDEALIAGLMREDTPGVQELRQLPGALRVRYLERFLKRSGIPEPEQRHLDMVQALVFSDKPSARADFPGGITVARCYDALTVLQEEAQLPAVVLPYPGTLELPQWGIRVSTAPASAIENSAHTFTVLTPEKIILRTRAAGDSIRLSGGTKTLKKLMIDRKIPLPERSRIPVITDGTDILGVSGIGVNLDRAAKALPAVTIRIEKL